MTNTASDFFLGFSQTDWTGIAAIAQSLAAIAAAGALAVAAYQIREIRRENKKARTLAACERYDLDPTLVGALVALRNARVSGDLFKNPDTYGANVHTIINFLDQLAIGAEKDAYSDPVLYDYMFYIFDGHYTHLVQSGVAAKPGWEPKHFDAFQRVCLKWRQRNAQERFDY